MEALMSGEITVVSWNDRNFNPAALGSDGNHTCLWDIARETLVRDGYKDASPQQIYSKVSDIVSFHNQQTNRPGFQRIENPDVIRDGQVIFVPPEGTAVTPGTKLTSGDKVQSPDGKTVLSIEPVKNDKGQTITGLVVSRDDGQGFKPVFTHTVGTGVNNSNPTNIKTVEVAADGRLLITDDKDNKFYLSQGQSKNARLIVQNDGHVVLYGDNNSVLWKSDTQRKA
jgi:hypothetical protein